MCALGIGPSLCDHDSAWVPGPVQTGNGFNGFLGRRK